MRAWRRKNAARLVFSDRAKHVRRRYGLELDAYEALLEQHDHLCGICREPEKIDRWQLCVDHDHETGRVRGLLCRRCGNAQDRVALLQSCIAYLERHAQ